MTARIIQTFDQGWGPMFPLKQVEQSIVQQWLATQPGTCVVVNSTWYNQQYHARVLEQLKNLEFDQIVLVSMLDAAIVQPDWFSSIDRPVQALGYYRGSTTIDFWALVVNRYFQQPVYDCIATDLMDTAYMCLNRKPHPHRKKLYDQLVDFDIADRGFVSMGGHNGLAVRYLPQDQGMSDLAPNAGQEQNGINNDIMSLGHPENWRRHFLNVVTETQFDIKHTYFVSEKIYKPVLGFRPFLVYATDGAVEWLTERGFEPYVQDFTDITDRDLSRPENIAPFLTELCQQSQTYWRSKYLALKEKILYNNNNFYNYIKGIPCQI